METELAYDIGSNKGEYIKYFCFANYKKIIAIEPHQHCIDLVKKRLANWPEMYNYNADKHQIIFINKLVSDKDNQEIPFYITKRHPLASANKDIIFNPKYRWANDKRGKVIATEVRSTITIDTLISQYGIPNIIKIDVEGFEYNVVKGLSQKVPEIFLEWHEEVFEIADNACKHLISIGFTEFGYCLGEPRLNRPKQYYKYNDLPLHSQIKPDRQELVGMIWVR